MSYINTFRKLFALLSYPAARIAMSRIFYACYTGITQKQEAEEHDFGLSYAGFVQRGGSA